MSVVLFIFRRDFRVKDNLGLHECFQYANKHKCKIIPAFIIDAQQVNKNAYFSNSSFQFLSESIVDLNKQIGKSILVYQGDDIFSYLKDYNIDAVFSNKDFTPYAKHRDSILESECNKRNIKCKFHEDYTLLDLDKVVSGTNSFYKVFTPFYNKAIQKDIKKVKNFYERNLDYFIQVQSNIQLKDLYVHNNSPIISGGREEAWNRLKDNSFHNYKKTRNFPYRKTTTMMSAYLKYGCISIREMYWYIYNKYGKDHELIRQLFWKEFYMYITHHFPHVLEGQINNNKDNSVFKISLKNKIKWQNNKDLFHSWCSGTTGYPIVDAGMRQLNTTGFMHNRLRMITSMFLIKDLHIDWRWGEKYFATKLIDYDPSSNNGGWQWSAGTGTDFKNYYRMFNPWTQTERFDIGCNYIKEWVPELKEIPVIHILSWYKSFKLHKGIYHPPIVNHQEQREKTLQQIYTK